MDLDDEELKATKELTGALAAPVSSVSEIDKAMEKVIMELSNIAGVQNVALIAYVNANDGDVNKRGFMSKTINLESVATNNLFLLDFMHSLIVSEVTKTSKEAQENVEKKEEE